MVVESIIQEMSKHFPAEEVVRRSYEPAKTVTKPDNQGDPVNRGRQSFIYNSVEEYVANELSDLLDNCSKRAETNVVLGLPLEVYLQNTLSSADARKWIKEQTRKPSNNVIKVLNKTEPKKEAT